MKHLPLLATLAFLLPLSDLRAQTVSASPMYSRHAEELWVHLVHRPHSIASYSPDHRSKVAFRWFAGTDDTEGHVDFTVSGQIGSGRFHLGPGVDSEILWSPDSKSFFITTSFAGLAGDYRLILLQGSAAGLRKRDLTPLLQRAFGKPVKCWPEVGANVAGVAWLQPSRRILAAAQVYPDTRCDSMGTFKAYSVDLQRMQVVQVYDQLTAKKLFADELGGVLAGADDSCARNPKSCWVRTNHDQSKNSRRPEDDK